MTSRAPERNASVMPPGVAKPPVTINATSDTERAFAA
jgi:hypothetical protein